MKLSDLLIDSAALDARLAASFGATEVGGISADSRTLKRGDVFVAVPGSKADGLAFAAQALAAGASAIVGEHAPPALPAGAVFVQVENARRTLALAAARLYPRQPAVIAAVTGTSGKTSVTAFTRQIWSALGHEAASIGTIGVVTPRRESYGSLTTPDPVALHRTLSELAGEGITHLAIEASSHGLDQHRLDGVRVEAGAFTNLSRDHLDYHPSVEAYLAAKLRLFQALVMDGGGAVIDVDHAHCDTVVAAAKARGLRLMTVGRNGDGIRLIDTAVDGFAQRLTVTHGGRNYRLRLPLVGAFQVENALVAAGLAIVTGGEPAAVFAALSSLNGAKGRLDLVGDKDGAPIFVDYAHKPGALEKALSALRPYVRR
ncbi:MAG: UDP-N-acetylmuramoyl-L-alanyl-D-glutamate--2,6-diaminopimelate ligase, partial [Xanthobacteraceae bacterium]